jgi:NAD(P)-dependent dehydrogenase (short-subunit alcohol dehydrogenase family)
MATKTAAAKTPAPRKKAPAAAKTVKAAAPAPAVAAKARPPRKAASARAVVKRVAKAIEASPVGKAGAVTGAVLRTRRAGLLSRRVRNKIVVVTGASSGIGEDCARKLAAAGATVILAARTPQKLQDTVDKIRGKGGKAFAYACDIADMADCDRFVAKVLAEHRHVDILINNAGRSIRRSVKFSFDRFHDFERTMQLNYFGALRLIFGFAPTMLERKAGHIINISSIGVLASPPRFSAYVASKAALDAFTWCAASEFADANVRFTTINMPLVRTPMIAPTKLYDAFPTLSPDQAAELVMSAVIDKPKRVATGLGLAGAVVQAVAPGVSEFVLNQAYRLFPDSPAARGLSDEEAAEEMAKVPKTPVDMARKLFAQVFSGVHW